MADLKLLTVRALRELAKEHLGTGFSKLKTKSELVAALEKVLPADARSASGSKGKAAPKAGSSKPAAPAADTKRTPRSKAPPPPDPARLDQIAAKYAADSASPPPPLETKARPAPPVLTAVPPPEPVSMARVLPFRGSVSSSAPPPPAPSPAPEPPKPAGPVAASAKSRAPVAEPAEAAPVAPRVHVPSAAELALQAENLGSLPTSYDEDDVTLLARDPHTIWVSWDFARQTERRAHEGMHHATPVLRLFDGMRLVREVEIALEARSWYIYNVIPGHKYRAEIHYVAQAGKTKQVGPSSNGMAVPPEGPSAVLDTQFIALPPIAPLPRPPAPPPEAHTGAPFPAERRDELLSLAEKMLREELPVPALPLPPVAEGERGAPVRVAPQPSLAREGGEGREEVRFRTRWVGSSDQVTEHYRVWVPGQPGEQRGAERTRFGGRWTSSRPA